MTIAILALIGTLEAVVLLWRIRSANQHSPTNSAAATFATCTLRIAFVGAGAHAYLNDANPTLAIAAYATPAAAVTWWVHRGIAKRTAIQERRTDFGA